MLGLRWLEAQTSFLDPVSKEELGFISVFGNSILYKAKIKHSFLEIGKKIITTGKALELGIKQTKSQAKNIV